MKRIEELLSTASPQELSRARRLLQSNQFLSAKFIDDAGIQTFEAMITYHIAMEFSCLTSWWAMTMLWFANAAIMPGCVFIKSRCCWLPSVCWKKTARITTQLSSKELQTR